MIIWGTRGFRKFLGATRSVFTCQRCSNTDHWHILEIGRKFTLFFIPLFSYKRSVYCLCPVCAHGSQINPNAIEQILNQ